MARTTFSCFERGALNLRGNWRLLLTLIIKSLVSLVVGASMAYGVLKILGLWDWYIGLITSVDIFAGGVPPEPPPFDQLPAAWPGALLVGLLGTLVQLALQTFFDGGALGVLAAGDRQAPTRSDLTPAWFENFSWADFGGWGGRLVWRLMAWRIGGGLVLVAVTLAPFLLAGFLWEATEGASLIAGCFAILILLLLVSLLWLWWWVVEMHLSFLPLAAGIRQGSKSFMRRGGAWILLTGIAFLLAFAVLLVILIGTWSSQMFLTPGSATWWISQVLSTLVQGVAFGAVIFLIWGAAIALAQDPQGTGSPTQSVAVEEETAP